MKSKLLPWFERNNTDEGDDEDDDKRTKDSSIQRMRRSYHHRRWLGSFIVTIILFRPGSVGILLPFVFALDYFESVRR